MKRHTFIQHSALAGMMAGTLRADAAPTVETTAGKIRGFAKVKVCGFRGVRRVLRLPERDASCLRRNRRRGLV
jgi:hypothetical protein